MARKKSPAKAPVAKAEAPSRKEAPVQEALPGQKVDDNSLINNGAIKFVIDDQVNGVTKTIVVDITEISIVGEQAASDIGLDLSKLDTAPGERLAQLARALKKAFVEEKIFPDDSVVATPTVAFEVFIRARRQAESLKKNMLLWQT